MRKASTFGLQSTAKVSGETEHKPVDVTAQHKMLSVGFLHFPHRSHQLVDLALLIRSLEEIFKSLEINIANVAVRNLKSLQCGH